MNILSKKLKYHIKNMSKISIISAISALAIVGIVFTKYKPMYKVIYKSEEIGYIKNKDEITKNIIDYANTTSDNLACLDIEEIPKFQFKLVSKEEEEKSKEDILSYIEDDSEATYRYYAVNYGENKEVVSSEEEANTIIEELKTENAKLDFEINVSPIYIKDETEIELHEKEVAKTNLNTEIAKLKKSTTKTSTKKVLTTSENTSNDTASKSKVAGVGFVRPISGTISSRFGGRRSGTHTGLDIAAPKGTPIKAAATGTVTYSGWSGGYGYMIKISHGSGVETYYAHCSSLVSKVGEKVNQGDIIAKVGSTGNSTGSHLHLEVRVNGNSQNPQNYVY